MKQSAHAGDGAVMLHRLRVRGFTPDSEEEALRLAPWLRFTPMLQAVIFGLRTITGAVPVLIGMTGILLLAGIVGCHPFDKIYSGVIRPLETSPELPPCPLRRRLVFLVGGLWCLVTAWAFSSGHMALGAVLGGLMTASTFLLAMTHICIPSLVLEWLGSGPRRLA